MGLGENCADGAGRPLPDDQVSVKSYQSDDFTLPGDNDDARSMSSVSTHDSYDSLCLEDQLPSYRVPRDQGVSQPVYEAWILYRSPDTQEVLSKTKICGVKVWTEYEDIDGFVTSRTEPHEQNDLTAMTLAAVDHYQSANKRCLPSRFIRGGAKSYEQHLDDRIRKLPHTIQTEINRLLSDREVASSNRFHRRDWTVAMIREQLHYRFSRAAYEEVKKHKMRFWKNKDKQPIEYFIIIRGGEGMVATDDKGLRTPRRHGNPWKTVDEEERNLKERARHVRHHGKEGLEMPLRGGRYGRRRERSMSPPPPPPGFPHLRRPSSDRSRSVSPAPPPPPFPRPFPPFNPYVHGQRLDGPMGYTPPPPPPGPYLFPNAPSQLHNSFFHIPPMRGPPPPPGFGQSMGASRPHGPPGPNVPCQPPQVSFNCSPGQSMPPPPMGRPLPMGLPCNFNFNSPLHNPPPPPPPPQVRFPFMPPSAPRPSNLTTPTAFSRASTNTTGSSAASTPNTTPPNSNDDLPSCPCASFEQNLVNGANRHFKACPHCISHLMRLSNGTETRPFPVQHMASHALIRGRAPTDGPNNENLSDSESESDRIQAA